MTMVDRLLGLTVAAVLVAPAPIQAQDFVFDTFREYVESLRVQAGIPGLAVSVVGQDQMIWEHPFGTQDIQRAIPTRTDTPFHLDGVTQIVTAALVLRCVEDGRLSLDTTVDQFRPDSLEGGASLQEILSHTTSSVDGVHFIYRPERLEVLADAVSVCTGHSFREEVGRLLDRLGMPNSVPGPDVVQIEPTAEYEPPVERYGHVLERLATPYGEDEQGRPVESSYAVTTLGAAAGLISSVQDLAWFDLALKNGWLVGSNTLARAWQPVLDPNGLPLPHGLGWFVETYEGQPVVWQFGVSAQTSSSLVVTLPEQGLTLIALANSDRLAQPLNLAGGGLTQSPFARLFLELFVR